MISERMKARYLITTEKSKHSIESRIVGSAYQVEGEDHMTIHLRFLPGITYFLTKNWMGYPEHILFSGRARREDGTFRFFHQIGSGFQLTGETIIEIHIPDFSKSYFIRLDPADFHLDTAAAA